MPNPARETPLTRLNTLCRRNGISPDNGEAIKQHILDGGADWAGFVQNIIEIANTPPQAGNVGTIAWAASLLLTITKEIPAERLSIVISKAKDSPLGDKVQDHFLEALCSRHPRELARAYDVTPTQVTSNSLYGAESLIDWAVLSEIFVSNISSDERALSDRPVTYAELSSCIRVVIGSAALLFESMGTKLGKPKSLCDQFISLLRSRIKSLVSVDLDPEQSNSVQALLHSIGSIIQDNDSQISPLCHRISLALARGELTDITIIPLSGVVALALLDPPQSDRAGTEDPHFTAIAYSLSLGDYRDSVEALLATLGMAKTDETIQKIASIIFDLKALAKGEFIRCIWQWAQDETPPSETNNFLRCLSCLVSLTGKTIAIPNLPREIAYEAGAWKDQLLGEQVTESLDTLGLKPELSDIVEEIKGKIAGLR